MLDTQVPLIDPHMLVATDGHERSLSEYDALVRQAGLRRIRVTRSTMVMWSSRRRLFEGSGRA